MVPEASFSSYYGRQIVKPAPWGWEIPAYLFLGGLAAGSGIIGAGAHATGQELLRRNARLTALAAVALSGAALVKDLGRPGRFLNMMRTVKLTSPMSVGTWILSAYSAGAGISAAAELDRMLGGRLPLGGPLRSLETPATVGAAFFAPPLAAYTAVLLGDTATPTWYAARDELPFVFVASASMASAGVSLLLTPPSQTGAVRALAFAAAATDVVAMHRLEHGMEEEAEPLHRGRAGAMLRVSRALTIAGGIGTLLVGRSRLGAALSGAALATASALTRFGIVEAGIESAKDPRYTVVPQKRRLAERRAAGRTGDSITTVG